MKVTYNADVCTHAGECVKGAPNVFKVVDGQFVIIHLQTVKIILEQL